MFPHFNLWLRHALNFVFYYPLFMSYLWMLGALIFYAKERKQRFSCARGLKLDLGKETHELDVFMLIDGKTPVCIECKSGEFRQNIDLYLALKKRLGLERRQFLMCIAGLEDEKARAFSAMYDLSFTNERGLAEQLAQLF